jgi:hypothetical protein
MAENQEQIVRNIIINLKNKGFKAAAKEVNAYEDSLEDLVEKTEKHTKSTQKQSKALKTSAGYFKKLLSASSSLAANLALGNLSALKSLDTFQKYNLAMIKASSSTSRFGMDIKKTKKFIDETSRAINMTKTATMELWDSFQSGFIQATTKDFTKLSHVMQDMVGADPEAQKETLNAINAIVDTYPEIYKRVVGLKDINGKVNKENQQWLKNQINGLYATEQAQMKELDLIRRMSAAVKDRTKEDQDAMDAMQAKQNVFEDFKRHAERVHLAMAKFLLPILEKIAAWLNKNEGTVERWGKKAAAAGEMFAKALESGPVKIIAGLLISIGLLNKLTGGFGTALTMGALKLGGKAVKGAAGMAGRGLASAGRSAGAKVATMAATRAAAVAATKAAASQAVAAGAASQAAAAAARINAISAGGGVGLGPASLTSSFSSALLPVVKILGPAAIAAGAFYAWKRNFDQAALAKGTMKEAGFSKDYIDKTMEGADFNEKQGIQNRLKGGKWAGVGPDWLGNILPDLFGKAAPTRKLSEKEAKIVERAKSNAEIRAKEEQAAKEKEQKLKDRTPEQVEADAAKKAQDAIKKSKDEQDKKDKDSLSNIKEMRVELEGSSTALEKRSSILDSILMKQKIIGGVTSAEIDGPLSEINKITKERTAELEKQIKRIQKRVSVMSDGAGKLKAQAYLYDLIAEKIRLAAEQTERMLKANQEQFSAIRQISQLETQYMQTMVQLADNYAMGMGASVKLRMRHFDTLQNEVGLAKTQLADLFVKNKGEESTQAFITKRLELENQIASKQLAMAQTAKSVRDGWISSIQAMNTGAGAFSKIVMTQTKATGMSIRMAEDAEKAGGAKAVRSALSGSGGGGFGTSERYSAYGPPVARGGAYDTEGVFGSARSLHDLNKMGPLGAGLGARAESAANKMRAGGGGQWGLQNDTQRGVALAQGLNDGASQNMKKVGKEAGQKIAAAINDTLSASIVAALTALLK